MMTTESQYLLGYWKCRGLAAPIRMLCAYTGDQLTETVYETTNKEKWYEVKHSLGLSFPNLPYFIERTEDGDVKVQLTQSMAILRYLSSKHDMLGQSPEEIALADMLVQEATDFKMKMFRAVCIGECTNKREEFLEQTMPQFLSRVQKVMDRGGGQWIVGKSLTYTDFVYWHELEKLTLFSASALDKFPKLAALVQRIEELTGVKEYLQSDKFIHWPIYPETNAKWGGGGEDPLPKYRK